MLQRLTRLKNKISSLNIQNKINIYTAKAHKLQVVNHLIIIYSNIKTNTIKTTQKVINELKVRSHYYQLVVFFIIIEAMFYMVNV